MVRLFMACGSLLCFQFVEVAFQNSERAHFNLDSISARVSAATARLLPNLLADSPDPDAALNLFERFTQEASRELLELLDRRPFLVDYAIAIFGYSQYLGEALIQNPDLLPSFASPQALDRSFGRDDYRERLRRFRGRASESEAAMSLARFCAATRARAPRERKARPPCRGRPRCSTTKTTPTIGSCRRSSRRGTLPAMSTSRASLFTAWSIVFIAAV